MLTFSTGLYRVAIEFASYEATRYYLGGVYVQRRCQGVLLTATDGHRMIVIHDANGFADEAGVIIKLDRWQLDKGKGGVSRMSAPKTGLTAAIPIGGA